MFNTRSYRKVLSLVTLVTFMTQILWSFNQEVFANDTAYYVDATAGSDANDGLSVGTPWQTLSHVSTQTLLPGDQILLKCGETWTDTLTLDDVGALGNEILIGTYGTCSSSSVVTLANTGAAQIQFASGAAHIIVSNITFTSDNAINIDTANNIQILQNRFLNGMGIGIFSSGAIDGVISNNYFKMGASGTGVSTQNTALLTMSNNTFSGGTIGADIQNSADISMMNNTFYLPATHAISVIEDPSVPAGTVQGNIISGNTFLTRNISTPSIIIDDKTDAIGTLAILSSNTYVNTYKYQTSIVEVLANGTGTITYDKNTIVNLDATAVTFNVFGYSSYTGDETRLLVNTGSAASDMSCPPMTVCGQQVSTTNGSVTFPTSVPAYSSKIILWNNSPNILRAPACTLTPSAGSVANGDPVTLTWTVTNGTGTTLTEPTATGGTIVNPVPNSGSGVYYPPIDDQVNHYELQTENVIGSSMCPADVTAQNNPPVQSVFFATGSEDATSITGTLEATDSSGDTVYFSLYTNSVNGTTTINTFNGLVTYVPNANFCGTDTFAWEAYDQFNRYSDPAFGTVTVLCDNDAPVTIDDTFSATGGQLVVLNPTTNDVDPDSPYVSQTYTVSGITLPVEGTLSASGDTFEYTPNFIYMGTDSFTYVTIDQSGAISNVGTITLNVAPGMNLAPTVSSGSEIFDEDTSILGTFSGSDANGDVLSFSAVTLPSNGILTISGAGFSYVPNAHFNGVDSFDFVAHDGFLDSSNATITLNVTPIMDIPVAVADTINVTMNLTSNIDVMANDTDADNPYQPQILTLTGISAPTNGTASIIGNQIQYTPNTLYLGPDSIDYAIIDQDGNMSNTGTVSITVSTTNQPPVADSGSFILAEDIPLTQTLSGSDPDLTPVTFVVNTNVSNGTLSLSSTGEFTYTPSANFNGVDSFTFHVTDGVFSSSIQTVTLSITAQNDNPLAIPDSFSVAEDGYLDTTVLANDSDADAGDVFVLNSVTSPINGTAVVTGSLITYTPNANYCGTDTFEYTTIDLSGATSNVGSVTMNVTCINDAPTSNNSSYTVTGNVATNTGNILIGTLSGADIDAGDILSYTIVQGVLSGTLTLTGGTFSYEGDIDFIGTEVFTYTATDLSGTLSNISTGTITVLPNNYNAVPVAYSDSFTVNEDTPISSVLSGSDLEGGALTYIIDQNVSSGVLTLSATGAFTYTPNAHFNGVDTFTFHVYDGEFSSAVVPVSITISSVNDIPLATNDGLTIVEDTNGNINPILNDTDADGDTLSLSTYTQGINGTVTASGNTVTYTPTANYCGTDSISYTAIDTNSAVSATGTIAVTVTCINDAPIATSEMVATVEDTPVLISVLTNDTDIENNTLSVASLTQPSIGGMVTISGTGVMFTPTTNFCTASPTTFTYQARDTANALSSVTTVTVNAITCVNDTPTSSNVSYTTLGNMVINSGTVLTGGTLTGYVATTNTLIRNLTSLDFDGDMVTFSGVAMPIHGTGTLSATGLLSYMPTPGYIGTDSMTFTVTDGTLTSILYTVTLTVQDPAPAPVTIDGPGGGGGGASQSFPTVLFSTTTSKTDSTVSKTGYSMTGLTNQLYVASPNLTDKKQSPVSTLLGEYQSLILPITITIKESQQEKRSRGERALEIRQAGRKLIHTIQRSIILSQEEKSSTISSVEAELSPLENSLTPTREARALAYVLRILKQERIKIEQSAEIVKYLLSI